MNFFQQFTVKKTRLPLADERLSCLYIQRNVYINAIYKDSFEKNVFARKFLFYRKKIKN